MITWTRGKKYVDGQGRKYEVKTDYYGFWYLIGLTIDTATYTREQLVGVTIEGLQEVKE